MLSLKGSVPEAGRFWQELNHPSPEERPETIKKKHFKLPTTSLPATFNLTNDIHHHPFRPSAAAAAAAAAATTTTAPRLCVLCVSQADPS